MKRRLRWRWRRLAILWRRRGELVRRVGVAVWVLRVLLLTPTPLAADTPAPPAKAQELRVQDVLIEGKLYSPQALFILSRPAAAFGTDAVLPHYLGPTATTLLLPYRVRAAVFAAAMAQAPAVAGDSTRALFDSRRSQ
jgi:hypothetical protein